MPKVVEVAYGSGLLREPFVTKFKSQFKRDFTKVVITRAGRLLEWSQEEKPLKVQVMAQQWVWKFRYAGKDEVFNTQDDVVRG